MPVIKKNQSVESILTAIATHVDPERSINPTIKFSGLGSVCHARVARAIKQRQNVNDKIWMYGYDRRNCMHSVLTDRNNRLVEDSLGSQGEFYREGGYKWVEGSVVPMLECIDIASWMDDYFLY